MSALESIIQWAQRLPDWQSDAVRRLLAQDELTDDDKAELLATLKARCGLGDTQKKPPTPQPVKRGDISGAPQKATKLVLKAMKDLRNVNAIPDGSNLDFGHEGLTVVYGENASGKSGYARVLKRACRARDTKERILPNVFKTHSGGPARAHLKISVESDPDQEVQWEDGKEGPEVLANVAVFDSKCARVIVDERNEAVYLPYGAHVFQGLAALLDEFRGQLEREKPEPKPLEYPDIAPTTEAGKFLAQLSYETTRDAVRNTASWTEQDEENLVKLQKRLALAQDRENVARRLRNQRGRIDSVSKIITQIDSTLSDSKVQTLKERINNLTVAEKALAVVSQESLDKEPLSGAGGNTWQMLYNAAKDYSTQIAYPGYDFPFTEEGSRCVLCMQPLSDDAKSRFQRFKDFMEQTTKKKVESAFQALQDVTEELSALDFSVLETYKDVLDEIRERDKVVARRMEEYFPGMQARASDMREAASKKEVGALAPPRPSPAEDLLKIAQQIENEAQEIEKLADAEELAKIKGESAELQARKLLASRRKEILDYVGQLETSQKYDSCIAETHTTHITLRGRAIVSDALTPKLRACLARELSTLGADYLPLNLAASGRKGETCHEMQLKGSTLPRGTKLTEILSEGEQCVVGIAGFLAELKAGGHTCPIVFDDPVCSLDHKYREKIAERVAEEAAIRQIIVFTHDIGFLLALRTKAGELGGVCFLEQYVYKCGDAPGRCDAGPPWHSMPVKDRLSHLLSELTKYKSLYPAKIPEYNEKVALLYGLLRETWESFVEEVLLYETIRRHSAEIRTQRLKSVTVTTEDYKAIHLGMAKCSEYMWGHDRSKALDVNRPSPEDIKADINKLATLTKDIRNRHDDLRKEREKSLQPEKPEVG